MAKIVYRDNVTKQDVSLETVNVTSDIVYDLPVESGTILTTGNIKTILPKSDKWSGSNNIVRPVTISNIIPNPESYVGEITIAPYKTSETFNGEHTSTHWQMSYFEDFSVIADETRDETFKTTWVPNVNKPGVPYYIRYKYISNKMESMWSETLKFKSPIGGINLPNVEVDNTSSLTPTFNISPMSTYGTTPNILANTRILIKKLNNGIEEPVVNGNIALGTILTKTIPDGLLEYNTIYNVEITQSNVDGVISPIKRIQLKTTNGTVSLPVLKYEDKNGTRILKGSSFISDVKSNIHTSSSWLITEEGTNIEIYKVTKSVKDLTSLDISNLVSAGKTYNVKLIYHGSLVSSNTVTLTFSTRNTEVSKVTGVVSYDSNYIPIITLSPFYVTGDTSNEPNIDLKNATIAVVSNSTKQLVFNKVYEAEVKGKYNKEFSLTFTPDEWRTILKPVYYKDQTQQFTAFITLNTVQYKSNTIEVNINFSSDHINGDLEITNVNNFNPIVKTKLGTFTGIGNNGIFDRVLCIAYKLYDDTGKFLKNYSLKDGDIYTLNMDIGEYIEPGRKFYIRPVLETSLFAYWLCPRKEFILPSVILKSPVVTVVGDGLNRTVNVSGFETTFGSLTSVDYKLLSSTGSLLKEYNNVTGANMLKFTLPREDIEATKNYKIGVRFNSNGLLSGWGYANANTNIFTINISNIFTITSPGGKLKRNSGIISNSSYSVTGGAGIDAEHVSSSWWIFDENNNKVFETIEDTKSKTSLSLGSYKIDLNPNKKYYFKLQYHSRSYGSSNIVSSSLYNIEGIEAGLNTNEECFFIYRSETSPYEGCVYGTVPDSYYAGVDKEVSYLQSDREYMGVWGLDSNLRYDTPTGKKHFNYNVGQRVSIKGKPWDLYECKVNHDWGTQNPETSPTYWKKIDIDNKLPTYIELLDKMGIAWACGNNGYYNFKVSNNTLLPKVNNIVGVPNKAEWVKIISPTTGKLCYITKNNIVDGLSYEYIFLRTGYYAKPLTYTIRMGTVLYYVNISTFDEIQMLKDSNISNGNFNNGCMIANDGTWDINNKTYWTNRGKIIDNFNNNYDLRITITPIPREEEPYKLSTKINSALPVISNPFPGGIEASYNPWEDDGCFGITNTENISIQQILDFYSFAGISEKFNSVEKWLIFYKNGMIKITPAKINFNIVGNNTLGIKYTTLSDYNIYDTAIKQNDLLHDFNISNKKYRVTVATNLRHNILYWNSDPYNGVINNNPYGTDSASTSVYTYQTSLNSDCGVILKFLAWENSNNGGHYSTYWSEETNGKHMGYIRGETYDIFKLTPIDIDIEHPSRSNIYRYRLSKGYFIYDNKEFVYSSYHAWGNARFSWITQSYQLQYYPLYVLPIAEI